MFWSKKSQNETVRADPATIAREMVAQAEERQRACRMLYTGTLFSSSPRLDAVMVLTPGDHGSH